MKAPDDATRIAHPNRHIADRAATVLQLLAILVFAVIVAMPLHKGFVDILALARKHPGGEFWVELGRYVLRNLAGG